MTRREVRAGDPRTMGVTLDGDGANFAVFSAHAERIELCLFDADGTTETDRIALPERTGHVWHGQVPGLGAGQLYGLRAHGPYAPDQGQRFNPNKLLIDPYARELRGGFTDHPSTYGYDRDAATRDRRASRRPTAPPMCRNRSSRTRPCSSPGCRRSRARCRPS